MPEASPARAAPPSPAAQTAPALISALKTAEGAREVTVRLDPAELGQVRIRIERAADGATHVTIAAERPETLRLLIRDEPRLREALERAGLPPDGRGMTFQLAPPDLMPPNSISPNSISPGASRSGGMEDGARHAHGGGQDGAPSRDRGAGAESHRRQPRPRWFRAGLDITA